VIDGWFYGWKKKSWRGRVDARTRCAGPADRRAARTPSGAVSKSTPQFALALRAYRKAQRENDVAVADGLIAWLPATARRAAVKRRG